MLPLTTWTLLHSTGFSSSSSIIHCCTDREIPHSVSKITTCSISFASAFLCFFDFDFSLTGHIFFLSDGRCDYFSLILRNL